MRMSLAPSGLLPVAAPPHDPYSLMLAGHIGRNPDVGWRAHARVRVDVDLTTRALVLAPSPAEARWLTEPNGSFGGLRLPPNVVATAEGHVFVLDTVSGDLLRFDPCDCRFAKLSCFSRVVAAGAGCDRPASGPHPRPPLNQLLDPQAIAVCAGDLFVVDRGHQRIVRYALQALLPRNAVHLPAAQRAALIGQTWHPTGLAIDGKGRLVVSDPINGRVDRFDARGRWLDVVSVGPGATHIAIDCSHRAYVVVERDQQQAITVGAANVSIELDAQSDGFHWQTLGLSSVPPGARFAIQVYAGDDVWTVAELNDPQNNRWSLWLKAEDLARALVPLPLAGALGRYLRVRFVRQPGHVPTVPFDVLTHGARVVRVAGTSPAVVPPPARADVVEGFGRAPVFVDQNGHLHLRCAGGCCVFDLRGQPVRSEDRASASRFERSGYVVSKALDSAIDGCQWHRVELRGAIPAGCSVEMQTTTAAIELTSSELVALPATAWSRPTVAVAMEPRAKVTPADCAWDALIFSPAGRYLWLKLVLRGDGRTTPCVSAAILEYPRISLRRYLPGVFGVDPVAADFTDRFTAIFDRTLRSIEGQLDRLAMLFDPLSAPADATPGHIDFLSWLGDWIGVTASRDWPVARRRRYLKEAARLYCQRGTPSGLWRQLLLLLGFDLAYSARCLAERPRKRCVPLPRNCNPCPPCEPATPPPLILEHFKLRRWLYAGHARLGSDSVLWGRRIVNRSELSGEGAPPSGNAQVRVTALNLVPDPLRDPFHVYAHKFSVFVPARVRDNPVERRALEQLLAREAPAHTQVDVRYVEPRFRVGVQASIGLDAVVARTPRGVPLGGAPLGQGTVLTGRWTHGPDLEVGNTRVGTTTRLT